MSWKKSLGFGLALWVGVSSAVNAQAPVLRQLPGTGMPVQKMQKPDPETGDVSKQAVPEAVGAPTPAPIASGAAPAAPCASCAAAPEEAPWGPTPLTKVGILEDLIYGADCKDKAPIKFSGWMDVDYTYRSNGAGVNNVAPVMNRFGDELIARQLGLYIYKPLDAKELSWGFNAIFIAGADASFLQPTAGGWNNTDPRFGTSFTDLNLTAHLPILTEGGVDVKAGRQTTVLGPMGALAWQRTFNSSDYAWYVLEEGRYTGISANWMISKQLSWYNGIEVGGWGVFFDDATHNVNYIGQVNYWLDCEAKVTKVWATILTGPTGIVNSGNTTAVEAGLLHNWNKYVWQIVDFQANYSKAPLFVSVPKGYQERAYDVYTYLGFHLSPCVDLNTRLEWYKDVDGGFYPGGFPSGGAPHNNYYAATVGIDYHPVKWLQFRPEIRYDHADKANFGRNYDKNDQLSISADVLLKF